MKLTPSSTIRLSVAVARSRLAGSSQTPGPVILIAPNPRRLTVRSPPMSMVPAAAAVGCAFTRYLLLVVNVSLTLPPRPQARGTSGGDFRPGRGQFDRLAQILDVVGAVMAHSVDEERGGSRHARQVGGVHVLLDVRPAHVLAQVGGESLGIEAERRRVPDQVADAERVLMVEQPVVHVPERTLPGGRL